MIRSLLAWYIGEGKLGSFLCSVGWRINVRCSGDEGGGAHGAKLTGLNEMLRSFGLKLGIAV